MKIILAICMIAVSTFVFAGNNSAGLPSTSEVVKGEVLEVKEIENFTYLRLDTKDGEIWAAIINARVKKGAHVTIENVTVMNNFESKSLHKTFPTILFGSLGVSKSDTLGVGKYMAMSHLSLPRIKDVANANIPKATGANAFTVEDIVLQAATLKGKSVQVRGKVVKYNAGIMGKNWIHLRDGSGNEANNTNDILVTTTSQTMTGDVVTVKGIVAMDKDFGSGYSYKVLVEDASLQQ